MQKEELERMIIYRNDNIQYINTEEKEKHCILIETDDKIINIEQSEIKYRIEKVFLYSITIILKNILNTRIITILQRKKNTRNETYINVCIGNRKAI